MEIGQYLLASQLSVGYIPPLLAIKGSEVVLVCELFKETTYVLDILPSTSFPYGLYDTCD